MLYGDFDEHWCGRICGLNEWEVAPTGSRITATRASTESPIRFDRVKVETVCAYRRGVALDWAESNLCPLRKRNSNRARARVQCACSLNNITLRKGHFTQPNRANSVLCCITTAAQSTPKQSAESVAFGLNRLISINIHPVLNLPVRNTPLGRSRRRYRERNTLPA